MPDWKPAKRIRDRDTLTRYRLRMHGEPCEMCEMRPGAHVHHRQFRSQGGADHEDNFSWLCVVCHGAQHGERVLL